MSGSTHDVRRWLAQALEPRLTPEQQGFLDATARDAARLVADDPREHALFATWISLASRHAPRAALAPSTELLRSADALVAGWNPERWSVLDAVRAALVSSRVDLARPSGRAALEECFRCADFGEQVSLYRTLALLSDGAQWRWRAGEGARSSMRTVFEAIACDSPFAEVHFDAPAWRQLVIKALFVDAPVWRIVGLDRRLDAELARMALDLAEERRAAGREVAPQLWACLGAHGGERALASLAREFVHGSQRGRRAAALGLARAGAAERVAVLVRDELDPATRAELQGLASGPAPQAAFRKFAP